MPAHQNPLRPGDPRRPSRTGRGRRRRIDPDRDLCPHRDRLSAAGHRGEISKLAGREISRDVIASLKRHGLIDGAIRAPQPGAPFAYVTTRKFLEAFGFASLRDLPDLERLKAEGLVQRGGGEADLDSALGLGDAEDDGDLFPGTRSWVSGRCSKHLVSFAGPSGRGSGETRSDEMEMCQKPD